jgi:hypothetical protein
MMNTPLRDLMIAHQAIWVAQLGGWLVNPDDVAGAFIGAGFAEYRREIVRSRRDRRPLGGVWQGLDHASGRVACQLWVNNVNAGRALVFVEVNGVPLEGGTMEAESWWGDLDTAVLHCVAEGAMDPAEIGRRLGISTDAATSLLMLLAREGKVRIRLVGGPSRDVVRSFRCPFRGQQVTVEFAHEHAGPVKLNWCSAFSPPTAITCGGRCLELDGVGVIAEPTTAGADSIQLSSP